MLLKTCRISWDSSRNCVEFTSSLQLLLGALVVAHCQYFPSRRLLQWFPCSRRFAGGRYSGLDTGINWHQLPQSMDMGTLYVTFLMCGGPGVWRFWACFSDLSRYIQNYQQVLVSLLLTPVACYMLCTECLLHCSELLFSTQQCSVATATDQSIQPLMQQRKPPLIQQSMQPLILIYIYKLNFLDIEKKDFFRHEKVMNIFSQNL